METIVVLNLNHDLHLYICTFCIMIKIDEKGFYV